jgi:uncharacterized protein with PIN domain
MCKETNLGKNFNFDLLIDANLGKLAKHLRFYGISVFFSKELDHFSLEKISNEQKINLLTTAKNHKMKNYCLQIPWKIKSNLTEQLKYISENYQINNLFDLDKTRCGLCNTLLSEIQNDFKFENLPPKTRNFLTENQRNGKVWFCTNCRKYYWEGTHWQNIKSKIISL